jgi:glutathione synthase/RimK-type ligase-like ATP-grasp enzyme
VPDLDPDDRLLAAALAARGVDVEPAVWDAPVDWKAYDLAVLRSTWDYPPRRDAFVAWAREVPRLANPADVVAWNTDKRYLRQLAEAGVPVVPTQWIAAGDPWEPPAGHDIVIKPAVGAGSVDSGRYSPPDRELAIAQVARLVSAGRLVMVQPYLEAVDTYGESALLFLAGRFSHAVRKGPLLTGPDFGVDGLYREEDISPRQPSAAELAVAEQALAALPFDNLLYARVDVVPGPDGAPLVIEVELTEPSLFFGTAEGAADRLADEILLRLHSVPIRQV